MSITRSRAARITSIVAALSLCLPASTLAGSIDPDTEFYVATPNPGAIRQIAKLVGSKHYRDAALILNLITTPVAEWYTQGTPKSVKRDVQTDVNRAAARGDVPVLVAYNIPFRDCAQFSAGGATTVAEYKAWIDGFAAGIGKRKAIVILEPDGLGIIPWYNPYGSVDGDTLEWCQPAEANSATAAADRFAMLNYAVDKLKAQPRTQGLPRRHAQRVAGRRGRGASPRASGRRPRRRLLPQRFELPVHGQLRPVRNLGVAMHRLRDVRECGRLLRVPEPVLERRAFAGKDRGTARRMDRRRAERVRRVERRLRHAGAQHVGPQPALREHARRDCPDDALRGRHEPERSGAMAIPRRHVPGSPGLVQPTGRGGWAFGRRPTPATR